MEFIIVLKPCMYEVNITSVKYYNVIEEIVYILLICMCIIEAVQHDQAAGH